MKFIPEDQMQNRMAILLCNLKPSKMRGINSEAMVMCASTPEKVCQIFFRLNALGLSVLLSNIEGMLRWLRLKLFICGSIFSRKISYVLTAAKDL